MLNTRPGFIYLAIDWIEPLILKGRHMTRANNCHQSSKNGRRKKVLVIWGCFAAIEIILYQLAGYAAGWDWVLGTMYLTLFFICFLPSIFLLSIAVHMTRVASTYDMWSDIIRSGFAMKGEQQRCTTLKRSEDDLNSDPYAPGSAAWYSYGPGSEESKNPPTHHP